MNLHYVISERKALAADLSDEVFQVCNKPEPGSVLTLAYFHLPPFVNVASTGAKVGCDCQCVDF